MTAPSDQAQHAAPYLIDGHVHLHDCFDERRFFDAAAANFEAAGLELGLEKPPCGILMLTESSGCDRFSDLQRRAGGSGQPGLDIETTGESHSLLVLVSHSSPMLLVAGRQLVTAEHLEVLALGCTVELEDGLSLVAALERVREAGALPVLPWGVGKWRFGRRRALLDALWQQPPDGVLLGDNGGRASFLPKSSIFNDAITRGIRDLPGSDPLPLAHEEKRVGSCGAVLEQTLDPRRPASDLLALLARPGSSLRAYGRGIGPLSFVRNQLAMLVRKWHSSYPTPG